jgi:two-component system, response regulator PdtaR
MISDWHVLIIEDEPLIALQVQAVLEDRGLRSFAFANTQESAIEEALRSPPQAIVSDVKLLSGTGPLAVQAIQERLGDVPVIFLTASPLDCVPCSPPGQVLCKPLDEPELSMAFSKLANALTKARCRMASLAGVGDRRRCTGVLS